MPYFVYILRCADQTYYCGSTRDLRERLKQHNGSKSGAHYTKIRRPVALVYFEKRRTLRSARRREAEIKRMTRKTKEKMIQSKNP